MGWGESESTASLYLVHRLKKNKNECLVWNQRHALGESGHVQRAQLSGKENVIKYVKYEDELRVII